MDANTKKGIISPPRTDQYPKLDSKKVAKFMDGSESWLGSLYADLPRANMADVLDAFENMLYRSTSRGCGTTGLHEGWATVPVIQIFP